MSTTTEQSGPVKRFSYRKAMAALTDTEKARILCVALTVLERTKATGEDIKIAAAQYGGAEGGFARQYSAHMKKLKDNDCYIIDGENIDDVPLPAQTASPAKTPKKSAPKRKAADEGNDEDGDAKSPTPAAAKKPRGRPKKAVKKEDSVEPAAKDEDADVKEDKDVDIKDDGEAEKQSTPSATTGVEDGEIV